MLDRKFIFENIDAVKENCVNRNLNIDLDSFVELETNRRSKLQESEELNKKSNDASKLIGKAKDDAERESLKEEARKLREQKGAAQEEHDRLAEQILAIQKLVPNMAHADAPIGKDDKANLKISDGKTPVREFDFEVMDHLELGQHHDWIDFEGGARTTGSGFYFLKGDLVLLDLALQQFAVNELVNRGFTPTMTPDLARNSVLEGIGFNPRAQKLKFIASKNQISL